LEELYHSFDTLSRLLLWGLGLLTGKFYKY